MFDKNLRQGVQRQQKQKKAKHVKQPAVEHKLIENISLS